jgi:nucleolar protein 56
MKQETKELNKNAISVAVKKISKSYSPDKMIIQAVQALTEEEHCINIEYERLRDFLWRYYPELIDKIKDVEQLTSLLIKGVEAPSNSMGYELNKQELGLIKSYSMIVKEHLKVIKVLEGFIKEQTSRIAPITSKTATPLLTAKLMTLAGSFKSLALMPASTIQLLGAEKALFRHLRSRARPPKHGIILSHSRVQTAKNKGKAARQLANEIMKSVRIDYFGGRK